MNAEEASQQLDPDALDRVLRLGGTELLERLVSVAGGNVEGRLEELDKALAAEPPDLVLAQRACHSMKSSAAYLGLVDLRDLAEDMEIAARTALEDGDQASTADELRLRRQEIPHLLEAGVAALQAELDKPG